MVEPLRIRIVSAGLPPDVEVFELNGKEAIGRLFELDVGVVCPNVDGLDDEAVLVHDVELVIEEGGKALRRIFGMVSAVREVLTGADARHPAYRLTVVPRAWLLTLHTTSTVFTAIALPDIFRAKLGSAGLTEGRDFELRLKRTYAPRDLVVQYAETDLCFCMRLAEHSGISMSFEHAEGRDIVVFTDDNAGFEDRSPKAIAFRPAAARGVRALEARTRTIPTEYRVHDYNYRTPKVGLAASAPIASGRTGSVTEYGAHFKTTEEADWTAQIRAEELACRRRELFVEADLPVAAGVRLQLEGHPRRDGELLVVEASTRATQATFLAADVRPSFSCELSCIPASTPFRPERVTPRPRIFGSVNGVVEAAERGQYAEIDEQGRYHVRFMYDTSGKSHAEASHWVRMAQPHAGPGYGFHFPLRDGTEVLLSFIDGDPDRPFIVGAIPNPTTPSTVTVPNSKHNVIRTGGGNFIDIDDTEGAERIKLSTPHADTIIQMGAPNAPNKGLTLQTDANTHVGTGKDTRLVTAQDFHIEAGDTLDHAAPEVDILGRDRLRMGGADVSVRAGTRDDTTSETHTIKAGILMLEADRIILKSPYIALVAEGSVLGVQPDQIRLKSPLIKLNCD